MQSARFGPVRFGPVRPGSVRFGSVRCPEVPPSKLQEGGLAREGSVAPLSSEFSILKIFGIFLSKILLFPSANIPIPQFLEFSVCNFQLCGLTIRSGKV